MTARVAPGVLGLIGNAETIQVVMDRDVPPGTLVVFGNPVDVIDLDPLMRRMQTALAGVRRDLAAVAAEVHERTQPRLFDAADEPAWAS